MAKKSPIDKIDEQIAQLQARKQKKLAQERERKRKRDERRASILGGALVAAVRRGDQEARDVCRRIVAGLSEPHRKVVAGWEPDPGASQPGPGGPGADA